MNENALLRIGLNPEVIRAERSKMQEEMASLSTDGETFFLERGHITILAYKRMQISSVMKS